MAVTTPPSRITFSHLLFFAFLSLAYSRTSYGAPCDEGSFAGSRVDVHLTSTEEGREVTRLAADNLTVMFSGGHPEPGLSEVIQSSPSAGTIELVVKSACSAECSTMLKLSGDPKIVESLVRAAPRGKLHVTYRDTSGDPCNPPTDSPRAAKSEVIVDGKKLALSDDGLTVTRAAIR